MSMPEMKACSACGLELPASAFTISGSRGYRYLKSRCKKCEAARIKAYYHSSPEYRRKTIERNARNQKINPRTLEKARQYDIKTKYGITIEQYDALLTLQDGKCALCGAAEHGRNGQSGRHADKKPRRWSQNHWSIDHCHDTGRVRGLLCHKCNVRVGAYEGLMRDVGEVALRDYLNRPSPIGAIANPRAGRRKD